MKLSRDEQELIEIKEINHLESIEIKDLFQTAINGKRTIVPGFIISYDEPLKMMFKTTLDKHFDDFIKRVKEVYLEEERQLENKTLSEVAVQKHYAKTLDKIEQELKEEELKMLNEEE